MLPRSQAHEASPSVLYRYTGPVSRGRYGSFRKRPSRAGSPPSIHAGCGCSTGFRCSASWMLPGPGRVILSMTVAVCREHFWPKPSGTSLRRMHCRSDRDLRFSAPGLGNTVSPCASELQRAATDCCVRVGRSPPHVSGSASREQKAAWEPMSTQSERRRVRQGQQLSHLVLRTGKSCKCLIGL